MKANHSGNRIDTTLGDLIAVISDFAFEYTDDTDDAYRLAGLVLAEMLKNTVFSADIDDPPFHWH